MKKVLVYGISGGVGGVESVIFSVVSNADREKVQFDILTYYDVIEHQEEYLKLGVKIYTITSRRKNPILNKLEMRDFFKKHASEYDVIWCNLAELINIDILKLAKKYGIKKRIIHSHSVASTRGAMLTKLHQVHRKTIGNVATDFWACSKPAGVWFYNDEILKSDKFVVIKNAIDTEKYIYDESLRKDVRNELGLQNAFVVGYVGRFSVVEKNTLFLLEVFKAILNRRPEAKLLLVGDGDDRTLVEEKIDELAIREQTLLLGFRKDVSRLMNAMDIFVLPSKMEGLGLVLIEAQAMGLPCFTSDKVVPKEVAITDLVNFIGLEKTSQYWAEQITTFENGVRSSKKENIQNAGYDVKMETKRVEKLLVE